MSEYIITDKQLQTATEAYLEHELSRPITEVFVSGDKLPEIVRCRDCIYYKPDPDPIDPGWPMMCERTGDDMVEPDGFCAWGERRPE